MISSVFKKNLDALCIKNPILAKMISNEDYSSLETIKSKNGYETAKLGSMYLHSKYDPISEAEKIVKSTVDAYTDCVLLLGLGLGYVAQALVKSELPIYAIETNIKHLCAIFHYADISDIVESPNFSIIYCDKGVGLLEFLTDANPLMLKVVENAATVTFFDEDYKLVKDQISRYKNKNSINEATLKRFGKLWVKNLATNIRHCSNFKGISCLNNLFADFPALVLAAGPSLDEILPNLAELREHCLIICVDTALRSVLAFGIKPDFVLVVDPQYWNSRHLDNCDMSHSILITETAVYPAVLRHKCRQVFLCTSIYPLGRYVEEHLGLNRGALGAGGSVATSSWDFARILGCKNIFMAGLDLSFPDGKTHAKASLFEQKAIAKGTRLHPASNENFLSMISGMPTLARANNGLQVVTDRRMSLYSWWFTNKAGNNSTVKTYNLSAKGLEILGLQYEEQKSIYNFPSVRGKIDKILQKTVDESFVNNSNNFEVENVINELVIELEQIIMLSSKAEKIAQKLYEDEKASCITQTEIEQTLHLLDEIDKEILCSAAKDVVGFLFSSVKEAVGKKADSFLDAMKNTAALYEEIANSARWHSSILKNRNY